MQDIWQLRNETIGGSTGAPGRRFTDDHCPSLFDLMAGQWDPERKIHLGVRYRLKITVEGSLVKVNLWAHQNAPQWFWSFTGLEAGMEKINEALEKGMGDWRNPKPVK